jgi:hypothetical protein
MKKTSPIVKSILLSISIFIYFSFAINAQIRAKNTVFAEIGGNSPSIYSFNYDRIFYQKDCFKMSFRAGFAWYPSGKTELGLYYTTTFPIELNLLLGKSRKYFELGLGYTQTVLAGFTLEGKRNSEYIPLIVSPRIGYRYQKDEGGFFFRIGYTPLLFPNKDFNGNRNGWRYTPWLGISLGKSF